MPLVSSWLAHWTEKLRSLSSLKDGWDGYSAPPPSTAALDTAARFLEVMSETDLPPTRLAASAVGGIGITVCRDDRKAYVEFYNDGLVCALFGVGDPDADVRQIPSESGAFVNLMKELQEYLDGRPTS